MVDSNERFHQQTLYLSNSYGASQKPVCACGNGFRPETYTRQKPLRSNFFEGFDLESDEQWRHQNVKVLFLKEAAMGPWIVDAVNEATGEVITKLEDDDFWKESKLERLFRLFAEIPQPYYFLNGILFIDAAEMPINVSERRQVKILGSEQKKKQKG